MSCLPCHAQYAKVRPAKPLFLRGRAPRFRPCHVMPAQALSGARMQTGTRGARPSKAARKRAAANAQARAHGASSLRGRVHAVGVVAGELRTLFGILVLSLPFLLILLVLVRLLVEQVVVVLAPGASAGAPAAALRVQVGGGRRRKRGQNLRRAASHTFFYKKTDTRTMTPHNGFSTKRASTLRASTAAPVQRKASLHPGGRRPMCQRPWPSR